MRDVVTDFADDPALQPYEKANQLLVSHVHPTGWKNPTPTGRYNMVVVGGGTAGLVTAAAAAGLGAKVALIEKHLLGGDCLNFGCVPSKALIRAARAKADVDRAPTFGVTLGGETGLNFAETMDRMRDLRAQIAVHDSASRFRDLGIDVFLGQATFTSRQSVRVGNNELEFKRACIATGASPIQLPIPGLADSGYLTNETVFSLQKLPPRLAVLGAGPIGCELAQSFARFGSSVTLIEMAPQILPREDPDAALIVQQALLADGVELLLDATLSAVRDDGGQRVLVVGGDEGESEVVVDELLVAVGRGPNVDGLGLEEAGVAFDKRKGVLVDDRMRTSNKSIYAAGDVASRFQFTHAADFMARLVVRNALFFGRSRLSALTIPWATYTDPEVAHVGSYPKELDEQGVGFETIQVNMADVDRALLDGEVHGFLKVHVKSGSDKILGATLVASHAGNMIGEAALAMTHGLGLKHLGSTIHPYPTQGEIFRKAGDAYNRTRLTPFLKRVFAWLMKVRR